MVQISHNNLFIDTDTKEFKLGDINIPLDLKIQEDIGVKVMPFKDRIFIPELYDYKDFIESFYKKIINFLWDYITVNLKERFNYKIEEKEELIIRYFKERGNLWGLTIEENDVIDKDNFGISIKHKERKIEIMTDNYCTQEEFDNHIEQEIINKGLTAPRVTLEHIKELEQQVQYECYRVGDTTTMCCMATLDGFAVVRGFSACIVKENFNEDIGKQIATDDAKRKVRDALFQFEGYRYSRYLNQNKE